MLDADFTQITGPVRVRGLLHCAAIAPTSHRRRTALASDFSDTDSLSYKQAGVDIEAGAELVRRIAGACKATHRPEMLTGLGGFAAITEIPPGYQQPVLVSGTDGVGTKLKLAIDQQRHDGVGQDLVAMCVNDVLVCGAEPFLFLDYYATGALRVDTAEQVIKGIAHGCALAGCSLAGGETAEMPGFYDGEEYDLAGFCVGVVEKSQIITGERVGHGDVLIGLPSSGPHSNGYSLIRRVLRRSTPTPELMDALLAPTRIYVSAVLKLLRLRALQDAVHGMVHITGGGFYENIPRILHDDGLAALIDLDSWTWPPVFDWLQRTGRIEQREMLSTFNCGIGFILTVAAEHANACVTALREAGEAPVCIGTIVTHDTPVPSNHIRVA